MSGPNANAEHEVGIVGREAELAVVERALERAAGGQPQTVLVTGAAGIGKSALLKAALASWPGSVASGSGDEDESHIAFALLEHLLRALPGARDVPAPGADTEPFRAAEALLRLFEEAQPGGPLAVVVDDAGWADLPSLQAITFAARRLRAEPVALLVACRDDAVARLPTGLQRAAEETGGRVDLTGLDVDGVAAIAARAYGRPLPADAAARLCEHTAGNPLHVRALVREVPFERMTDPGSLPAPRSFATLVISRLASCSDEAQRLLAALAVLGREAPLRVCASVAEVGDPVAAVDELARQGLAELVDGPAERVVRFSHDLVHASVLTDLSPAERARLHAAAASVTSGDRALAHRVAAAAGPDPDLLADLRAAAEERARRGAFEAAAELLEAAVGLAPDDAEREDVAMAAITHRLRAAQAPGPLAEELPGYRESPARSYLLGRMALISGRAHEAAAHLQSAWRELPAGDPLRPEVADTLALVAENQSRFDEVTEWARRSLEVGHQSFHSPVLLVLGVAMTAGAGAAEAEMSRLLDRTSGAARAGALLGRGIARVYGNKLDAAQEDLETAATMPEVQGSILALVNARGYMAECHYRAGRWPAALTVAEAIGSIADDADQPWLAVMPQATAAYVLAALGELERATAYAETAKRAADRSDLMPAHLWVQHARIRIAAAAGESERIVAIGDELRATPAGAFPEWVHHWRATYAEALIAAERLADAEAIVAELEAEADAGGDASVAADAARARGILAAARGEAQRAADAFAAGLALDPVVSRPFERAMLELAAGAHLRRAGQRRAAQAALRAALERLNALGARPWIERCERELRACGLRPAKRSEPGAGADLTAQERMVAHLVASGATNREVADELVLSVKTIEHHLGRIYRKLGIRSRTELAALLAAPEEPDPQD